MSPVTLNETNPATVSGGPTKPPAKIGKWLGRQITQKLSPASVVQNALEELAELQAERSEDEEVKKEEFHDLDSSRLKKKSDEINELIDKMEDDGSAAEVEEFVAAKGQLRNATPDRLLEEAKKRFPDPSWQFLALSALERSWENEPAARLTAAEAKQLLLEQSGPRVWGGINITARAKKIAATPAEVSPLRDFYAENTLGYDGILASYDKIINKFGETGVAKGVKFLLTAVADDLNAVKSSMPKEKLRAVLGELYSLELITTMHEGAVTMLKRLAAVSPGGLTISAARLMRSILTLAKQDWVAATEVQQSVKAMGASSPFERINVLREMRHMAARLPLKLTAERPETREKFITAVQQALDEAAEEEEQE